MSWEISNEMIAEGIAAYELCQQDDTLVGDPELAVMTIYNAMRRLEGTAPRLRRVVRSGLLATADEVIGGTVDAARDRGRTGEGSA